VEDIVHLEVLPREGGRLLDALEQGGMVAVLSGSEMMYIFMDKAYQCFIHPLDAAEGRRKTLEKTEPNQAIIKNLENLADQIFKITYGEGVQYMGAMVAAERGIIEFLSIMGQLPADDFDFMSGEAIPSSKTNCKEKR